MIWKKALGKYVVVVDPKALKFLGKLAKTHFETANQFHKRFTKLSDNPYSGKLLKGNYSGFYRIRVWDYRAVYKVIESKQEVFIAAVGHRKDIYR